MSQRQPMKRRRKRLSLVIVALVGLLVVIAAYIQVTALSYDGFLIVVRGRGAVAQEQGAGTSPFLRGADHRLAINGAAVDVYEYATPPQERLDAARISSDGSAFRSGFGPLGGSGAIVDFIGPPHWFQSGRIIVLYVGRDTAVLALLKDVLGEQFAGLPA